MQINDIRDTVDNLWIDASVSWRDEMAQKYKVAVIDELDSLLNQMNKCCMQLDSANIDALRKLSEFE